MAFLDDLKRWLRRESADARRWADEAVADGHAELDRAERRFTATPEERLQADLSAIEANDDAFAAILARADAAEARPLADRDLAEQERAAGQHAGREQAAQPQEGREEPPAGEGQRVDPGA